MWPFLGLWTMVRICCRGSCVGLKACAESKGSSKVDSRSALSRGTSRGTAGLAVPANRLQLWQKLKSLSFLTRQDVCALWKTKPQCASSKAATIRLPFYSPWTGGIDCIMQHFRPIATAGVSWLGARLEGSIPDLDIPTWPYENDRMVSMWSLFHSISFQPSRRWPRIWL